MRALWLFVVIASAAAGADKLTVKPDRASLTVGESEAFEVWLGSKPLEAKDVTVKVTPAEIGSWCTIDGFDSQKLTFTVPDNLDDGITSAQLTLTFEYRPPQGGDPVKVEAEIEVTSRKRDQWESRAVLGYHQAGASSADFTQNFFFDFFIMRGLGPHEKVYESRVNLWGNVRVASSPQQTTTSLAAAKFAANFATEAGKVKVNELAQSAEFQAGIDIRLGKHAWRQGNRVRMPSFIAYFGASGSFTQPSIQGKVFLTPGEDSAQSAAFRSRYPNVSTKYVGFVPPDRERFYRMWGGGFRLTSFDKDARFAPPATFLVTLGQDELITGGALRGLVSRFDVFYPLPVKDPDGRYKCLFLFGTANLRLSRANNDTPLILEPAAPDIKLYNPAVSIVTSRSTRDTYRIGVGIDFVNVWTSWVNRSKTKE